MQAKNLARVQKRVGQIGLGRDRRWRILEQPLLNSTGFPIRVERLLEPPRLTAVAPVNISNKIKSASDLLIILLRRAAMLRQLPEQHQSLVVGRERFVVPPQVRQPSSKVEVAGRQAEFKLIIGGLILDEPLVNVHRLLMTFDCRVDLSALRI